MDPKSAKKKAAKPVAETTAAVPSEKSQDEGHRFREALRERGFPAPIAHASYLINLASPDESLWQRSMEALEVEWRRSEYLGLSGLVLHPGAHLSGTVEDGLERVVEAIRRLLERIAPKHCRLLLENTAGQGSCLGWQFEQLGWLLGRVGRGAMLGVCLDTCHAFAAGYDFSTPARLKSMWGQFEEHIGLANLRAIHLNDSMKGLGSRLDRHEHIGRGEIGEKALGSFVRSSAVDGLPMILETAKGTDSETGEDWDVQNLATLRRLARTTRAVPLSEKAN